MTDPSQTAVETLRTLLTAEELDTDLYRGAASDEAPGWVFGGQVIAQALFAAGQSADQRGEERLAHSLHAYFLRAGDPSRPIIYCVLRDFDGGRFANRRVVAIQDGKPILNLAASFHRPEDGYSHAVAMPQVPPPEQCPDLRAALAATGQEMPPALLERLAAFDVRAGVLSPEGLDGSGMPTQFLWFRLVRPLGTDPTMQRVILAYASDFALVTTAVLPHPVSFFSQRMQAASLDHAVWFHANPPADDWLLFMMDSPWSGSARGFNRGMIFDRQGALVASVSQEGLIRVVDTPSA